MLSKNVNSKLNEQIKHEAEASQIYLGMAVWSDIEALGGASEFFYAQSEEEREHMLKIVRFVSGVGGEAVIPSTSTPPAKYKSLKDALEKALINEKNVTASINKLTSLALTEKDHASYNFLQWFVNEQLEEEQQIQSILTRFELIGEEGMAIHSIDKMMEEMASERVVKPT